MKRKQSGEEEKEEEEEEEKKEEEEEEEEEKKKKKIFLSLFFGFPCFFSLRRIPLFFLSVFRFFRRDLRGRRREKILVSLGAFS